MLAQFYNRIGLLKKTNKMNECQAHYEKKKSKWLKFTEIKN